MENKKNTILLTVIAVATLLVAVVGATFAYFTAQGGAAVDANINVATGTSATADFGTVNNMTIYADATTFASGKGNATGTSTGTVSWTAPGQVTGQTAPSEAERSFCYTVTITVNSNTFEYSQADSTAELLLNVTKGGTEITKGLTGLTYATVTDGSGATLKGWDITTGTPTINIPGNSGNIHKIVAAAGATETNAWSTKVTLVNLNADQNKNTNKNFAATLRFEKATCPAA